MLWVNLIMDTFGALALATEPPAEDILLRKPYNKNAAIVTENMQRNVFGHGIYQVIMLCVIIFAAPGWLCEDYWNKCVTMTMYDKCAWNPFYADGPYYLENDLSDPVNINWWKNKNLAVEDYDQTQLTKMTCMV